VRVTAAGVDTWSPCWYADPEGPAAGWLRERAVVPAARGSKLLAESVAGHRVGWFPGGLVFAEGHPSPEGLCRGGDLPARGMALQDALLAAGMPLAARERPFPGLGSDSEGFGGVRRVDATVNLELASRAEGVALLAGIAACIRDSPGKAEVFYGPDRGVETVALRGHAGKRVLGRWYDKGLESSTAARGFVIRGEDQRRWGKLDRRDVSDLSGWALRRSFQRRFYPLWKAAKGVAVAGPVVITERLLEAVEAGEITPREAESLAGHVMLQAVGGRRGAGISRATMYRREARARELGLVLADGVLQEVEVDVGAALEAALETELWDRTG
jgi:hypothetical protein